MKWDFLHKSFSLPALLTVEYSYSYSMICFWIDWVSYINTLKSGALIREKLQKQAKTWCVWRVLEVFYLIVFREQNPGARVPISSFNLLVHHDDPINTGLDIASVSVAFATKFFPFATKTSSAVTTFWPVFTQINKEMNICKFCFLLVVKIWKCKGKILLKFQTTQCINNVTRFVRWDTITVVLL